MVSLHSRKFVYADTDKCVGCQVCEYACSVNKERVFNPLKSRIRVVRIDQVYNMAVTCRLCENPSCVSACPRGALMQSSVTGRIILDKNNCNGCGWCIQACEYGAMMLHPEEKNVYVCDLCQFKPEGPQCVAWCPEGALTVVTTDVLALKARLNATKKFFKNTDRKK